jgi:hypothetical protein
MSNSEYLSKATKYYNAIKNILLKQWDPIGISGIPEASDEYDSYISEIYKMLINRSPKQDIFDYLWMLETEHMGLYGNINHTEKITCSLMNINNI